MPTPPAPVLNDAARSLPLFQAMLDRRARRFGYGMEIPGGPLAFKSAHPPLPLTEEEEAAIAFAGSGITGFAINELDYRESEGGNMISGMVGRTVASPDAIGCPSLVVSNDEGTWLMKHPRDFTGTEIRELVALAREGRLVEIYRRSRVKLADHRLHSPVEPLTNININRWSVHQPGATYFIPLNDLTFLYINAMLEFMNEHTGIWLMDERRNFRPAGVKAFARSRGGHLRDDPKDGFVATIQKTEALVSEIVTIEQGMMHQNMALMCEALAVGGFSNFAANEFGWPKALGFRQGTMPASKYLGASWLVSTVMKLRGIDTPIAYPLGLERDGKTLLKPFCPPYYESMEAAVRAVVDIKVGPNGVFRGRVGDSAWKDPAALAAGVPGVSERAVDATIAYCTYVFETYGRFPAYSPAYRTVTGFQAVHVDPAFFDRYYHPDVLPDRFRRHTPE